MPAQCLRQSQQHLDVPVLLLAAARVISVALMHTLTVVLADINALCGTRVDASAACVAAGCAASTLSLAAACAALAMDASAACVAAGCATSTLSLAPALPGCAALAMDASAACVAAGCATSTLSLAPALPGCAALAMDASAACPEIAWHSPFIGV
eukprot:Opistho-2@1435